MVKSIVFIACLTVTTSIIGAERFENVKALIDKALPTGDYEHRFWYEAADILREPLAAGDPGAKYYASFLYNYGAGGFSEDFTMAKRLALEAANSGFLPAMVHQAVDSEYGLSGEKNHALSVSWYQKAALAGSKSSASRLVEAYENGELGLERNDTEASAWLEIRGKCREP